MQDGNNFLLLKYSIDSMEYKEQYHGVKIASIGHCDNVSCCKQHSIVDLFHLVNQFEYSTKNRIKI